MYKMNKCMCNYMHMNPYQNMNNPKNKGMFMCPMMNMCYMNQRVMPCHEFMMPKINNISGQDDEIPKIKMKTVKLHDLID